MKPFALLVLLLALPVLAAAQCYTDHRDAGKKLLADKKYDEAIVRFAEAKKCQRDKPANGDKEIGDKINKIIGKTVVGRAFPSEVSMNRPPACRWLHQDAPS